jgi:hypothetical protein
MMTCDECGGHPRDGSTCRQQWDALLALEFSDHRAAAVHFLTVACYQLQHPTSFALTDGGRWSLQKAVRDVVVHGRPVASVRDAMQQAYDGSRRVRGMAATPTPTVRWSTTVADVGPPDPERHVGRVQAWAESVVADLERPEGRVPGH